MVIRGRKVWRTTAEGPLDALQADRQAPVPAAGEVDVVEPAPPIRRVAAPSSEAVTGLQVTEFEATLPLDVYSDLFKDTR